MGPGWGLHGHTQAPGGEYVLEASSLEDKVLAPARKALGTSA